jgi:hypothetical protein
MLRNEVAPSRVILSSARFSPALTRVRIIERYEDALDIPIESDNQVGGERRGMAEAG